VASVKIATSLSLLYGEFSLPSEKVALVTAAAGAGIGAAVAREFAGQGMTVVITDAHERRCQEYAESLSNEFGRAFPAYPLDVTDFEAIGTVFAAVSDKLGRIDVLVNNAGWNKLEPVAEMDPETWRRCLEVDLTGTFYCLRQVLPYMIEQGSGAIVNISSSAGWLTSTEHGAAYSAAKAGVMALTRVTAAEVGKHGIRVNAVAPGLIYNEFLRKIYPDSFFADYTKRTATGTIGQPEDVAALVGFLVSERARYITGEVYGMSGGEYPHA
jgi:3-oxoacyl-[acyl-carrier protein] reductase